MGRRKDQDAVYRERIRAIPVELYPLLLARAQRPFSTEDTTPFKTTGNPGDKYVTVAYRPDRNTKLSLGAPDRIPDILSALGFSGTAPSTGSPHALPAAVELAQTDKSAISLNDDLPHDFEEAPGSAEPSMSPAQSAANPTREMGVVDQADQVPPRLKSPPVPAVLVQRSDLARGVGKLSNSYWMLPSVCTLAMGLIIGIAELLALASSKSPASALAARATYLPQVAPPLVTAANTGNTSVGPEDNTQAHLPQPIKPEPLSAAVRGELGGLFAALHGATGHDQVVEKTNGVVCVSVQIDGAHSCGELLENYLFRSQYSSSAQEDGIRKLIRTGITEVSMRDGALFLEVRNPAAYEQAITDREDPSRKLSGLGVGHLWLAFKAEHIQVTEVSP